MSRPLRTLHVLPIGLSAALVAISGAALAQDAPYWYVEDGGIVAFEIEDGPTGNWSVVPGDGALGAGYLRWDGNFGGPDSSEGRRLAYRFTISEPGNYELKWRNRIDKGEDPTEHNDTWVVFPTGDDVADEEPLERAWTKVYVHEYDWTWKGATVDHESRPIRQYFAAGEHRFEIAARSDGHAIDRVVLYRYDVLRMNDDALDRTPLSLTTTDPAGVADAGGNDGGSGGDTGGDTVGDGDTTGGDTDGGSEDTGGSGGDSAAGGEDGQETGSDDAGSGDGGADGGADGGGDDGGAGEGEAPQPLQPIGTCEADRLVLAPSAESVAASGSEDDAPMLVAGDDGLVWLGFDLSAVPQPTGAALRLTSSVNAADDDTLTAWLGSSADVDLPPDAAVALGTLAAPGIGVGETFALALNPALLGDAGPIGIGAGLGNPDAPLSVASSAVSSSDDRPALILSGDAGFCEEHDRLKLAVAENEESVEMPDEGDVGEDSDGESKETSRRSGSGATGGLTLAALGLTLLAGGSRRRRDALATVPRD